MTCRDRFLRTLNFERPEDRLPMIEWAAWWDLTIQRWQSEGLSSELDWEGSLRHFGLDPFYCIGISGVASGCPGPRAHGAGILDEGRTYDDILPFLYSDASIEALLDSAQALKGRHDAGEVIVRLWLDGFFWFARRLFGIEPHMYAFYDHPEMMHRIHTDLAEFNTRAVQALFPVMKPDMVGFAEDMSYNHGPMLSYSLFAEFITPYYQRVTPYIREQGVRVLIDSDGDITTMVPWMQEAGIEGVYPLERQAGVDVAHIRREHPEFLMLGGYDKMVMNRGEDAMRAEFERLLPAMRSGGFIPSVDHQTPPGVSLADYEIYVRLFREYAERARAEP